jgi:protein-tyrosine phosphatase
VESGVLAQITAASLTGRFSNGTREFALRLLKQRLAHVLATDAHGMNTRKPELAEAVKEAEAIVGPEAARRMVRETPERILRGESVEPAEPLPFEEPSEGLPFVQRLRAVFRAFRGQI